MEERQKTDLSRAALDYHEFPRPGKISITATKQLTNQRDLALAYTPGVAVACEAIAADPQAAARFTARGNLVGVITNGTAVLGLGAIGPLAAKPVMEGKAVLFKKFAGIDVFDLEIDATDVDRFVAAVRNGLLLQGKALEEVRLVTSGAGAAAMACVDLLVRMGLKPEHVTLTDLHGVVHAGRNDLPPNVAIYAHKTDARSLSDVLPGADVFLGLSAPRVLKPEWLGLLADKPLILALANPE